MVSSLRASGTDQRKIIPIKLFHPSSWSTRQDSVNKKILLIFNLSFFNFPELFIQLALFICFHDFFLSPRNESYVIIARFTPWNFIIRVNLFWAKNETKNWNSIHATKKFRAREEKALQQQRLNAFQFLGILLERKTFKMSFAAKVIKEIAESDTCGFVRKVDAKLNWKPMKGQRELG